MSSVVRHWRVGLGVALLVGGLSNVAAASNGIHPRTPVEWNDTVCMQTVDKSTTSTWQLEYDIPFPDTEVTADEVPDSRRHQFFALCRQVHSQVFLPRWITNADLQVAVEHNLVENGITDPEDVFETSTFWEGCWERITADDERRPITEAMADAPVPWDVTAVPEGTYTIWGYTWEPAFNIWVQRQGGIVKVHDGGTPESIGPGAAITTREATPYFGDTLEIEGCVNTGAGSTMIGYYALTDGAENTGWEPQWVAFTDEVAVEGSTFVLEFPTPEEVAGETVMIRVDVTDAMDRTFEAHMSDAVIVLAGMNPKNCDDSGGFIGMPGCDDSATGTDAGTGDSGSDTNAETGGASTTSASGTGTSAGQEESGNGSAAATDDGETTPGQDPDTSSGCACAAPGNGGAPVSGWALVLLAAGLVRRRR